MDKIVIYNHGGSGNHGCEALARTVTAILKKDKTDIALLTESPQQDIHYGVDKEAEILPAISPVSKFSFSFLKAYLELKIKKDYFAMDMLPYLKSIKKIKDGTTAVSIGGDIYCYDDYPKYIRYHQMLCKKNCKTILMGCSLEPKLFEDPKFVEDMKSYSYISARESLTYELLKQAGLKNIGLCPDTAFTLPVEQLPLPEGFLENNMVGINLSPLVSKREVKPGIVLANYERLIEHILETTDCSVALIPHVVWEGNDDRTILKKLFDKYSDTGRIVMIEDCNCKQLKGYISRCRFFVGARTHATIAAYSTGVPTLVLGYSIKSRGIAKDLFGTDENYVIPVEQLSSDDKLTESFKWIEENEEDIRKHLEDTLPEYIGKVEKVVVE